MKLVYSLDTLEGDYDWLVNEFTTYKDYVHAIKLNSLYHYFGSKLNGLDEIVKLFLDLKLYDIPRTLIKTVEMLPKCSYITMVYANDNDVEDAIMVANDLGIKVLLVSVLTSSNCPISRAVSIYTDMCGVANKLLDKGMSVGVILPGDYSYIGKMFGVDVFSPGISIDGSKYNEQKKVCSIYDCKSDYAILGSNFPKDINELSKLVEVINGSI